MKATNPPDLSTTYVRLRSDATAELLPVDASFWERISSGKLGTFHNEYMISCHSFTSDWPMWEMHPNGDEIVCLLSGEVTFMLDDGNEVKAVSLTESTSYVAIPKGTWHTAKTKAACRMLFITAGEGTQHRDATE